MAKAFQVDKGNLKVGLDIIQEITTFRPYSSISFKSSEEIICAVQEAKGLAKWGMAKNKHKMKEAVIHILDLITGNQPEEPINLNLSKYELKSLKALVNLMQRVLDEQKDGVVMT
jgi:hypothetical protein